MFLTTECVITDEKEDMPMPAMPAGGMGGGMPGMM
jgi:chaperonin GroEL